MTFRPRRIAAIAAGLVVRLTPNEKAHMQHIGSYDIWARHRGVYGRRKLWKAGLQEGQAIGCDQVGRLVKILGVQKVLRRKAIRTTQSHPGDPRCADCCTRAWDSVTHPNQ